jgi:hypothetical protein
LILKALNTTVCAIPKNKRLAAGRFVLKLSQDVLNTVKRVNMSAHRLDTFLALASVNIGTTIENISYIPAG